MISWRVFIVKISKAANGSSKRSILGSEINAIAITNFFFWPPDINFPFMSLIESSSNFDIREFIFSILRLWFFSVISDIAFRLS